jgi:ribosomal protein S27AE
MPETQPYVEIEKKIRNLNTDIVRAKIAIERAKEAVVLTEMRRLHDITVEYDLSDDFEALIFRGKLATDKRKIISSLTVELNFLEWHQNQLMTRLHGTHIENEKRQFVRACPVEDCRGFLSTVWKCGVCENWTCPECHEVKGVDKNAAHTCDPNNIATAQLLARDSRNCPKCAALIFKINGCDQMYCTQCHTAFSWRSGRIETGAIHNPHYYEYMRARGTLPRNPGDVPCGGFPEWRVVSSLLINYAAAEARIIANAHRSWGHCQWALIPRFTTNAARDNRDLRIKYMIGDFDENEFKKKIQQREKAAQKKTDIRMVIEMYMAVLSDLFQSFVSTRDPLTLTNSLTELREHVNGTFRSISKRYNGCSSPRIEENYNMY